MLKTCLVIAGLLLAPLMVWLLAPALICFVALCILSLPFVPLLIMARRPAQSDEPTRKRGLPARRSADQLALGA